MTAPSLLVGIALFVLISASSIKLILPIRELANLAPLVLLFLASVLSLHQKRITRSARIVGAVYFGLFTLLILSFVLGPEYFPSSIMYFRYLSVIGATILTPLLIDSSSLRLAMALTLLWGGVLAVTHLAVGIAFGERQHYLTLGMPIGLGVLLGVHYAIESRAIGWRLIYILVAIVCLLASVTLIGRSPILFTAAMLLSAFALRSMFSGPNRKKFAYLGVTIASAAIGAWSYANFIPTAIRDRINRAVFHLKDEPRFEAVYIPAWEAIIENPIGYGLEASWGVIGFQPHNIVLEMAISGGVIAAAILVLVLAWSVIVLCQILAAQSITPALGASAFASMYLLLFWLTSYGFGSSYAVFPLIAATLTIHLGRRSEKNVFRCDRYAQ